MVGGNTIYWEARGTSDAPVALWLHGGPGSGLGEGYHRHFDLRRWNLVGLDQRGCGRSRPLAGQAGTDLAGNTTSALIADVEALRDHLGVDAWLVSGASWGTTLALAYAQAHPGRVTGLVLAAVTTTSPEEVEWITRSMGRIFPREWERFVGFAEPRPGESPVRAYVRLLADDDPAVRARAAEEWCRWEDVHVSLNRTGWAPSARYRDPAFRQVFATLVTHYWSHAAFAGPGGLLADADRIAHLPCVLIHGVQDVSGPLVTAWRLHRALPASRLVVLDDAGHGGVSMDRALAEEIARFAG